MDLLSIAPNIIPALETNRLTTCTTVRQARPRFGRLVGIRVVRRVTRESEAHQLRFGVSTVDRVSNARCASRFGSSPNGGCGRHRPHRGLKVK